MRNPFDSAGRSNGGTVSRETMASSSCHTHTRMRAHDWVQHGRKRLYNRGAWGASCLAHKESHSTRTPHLSAALVCKRLGDVTGSIAASKYHVLVAGHTRIHGVTIPGKKQTRYTLTQHTHTHTHSLSLSLSLSLHTWLAHLSWKLWGCLHWCLPSESGRGTT